MKKLLKFKGNLEEILNDIFSDQKIKINVTPNSLQFYILEMGDYVNITTLMKALRYLIDVHFEKNELLVSFKIIEREIEWDGESYGNLNDKKLKSTICEGYDFTIEKKVE